MKKKPFARLPRMASASLILIALIAVLVMLSKLTGGTPHALAGESAAEVTVDTALIVSVDVSSSVDEERYRLQMEGIAQALEDPSVIAAILNGPQGGILFSMVAWADRPNVALPWAKISSKEEALAVAKRVRNLPRQTGEFTCMARMLRSVNDKIVPQIPAKALRVVVDVSGDGPDNCNSEESTDTVRDELVATNVTVNGLPIKEGAGESTAGTSPPPSVATPGQPVSDIEEWYREHVMGGVGSFVLAANGYADFGRAIRQKFVIEISGTLPKARFASGIQRENTLAR